MNKFILPLFIFLAGGLFSGCSKSKYVTTPNPYMNVTIGPYSFNTNTVYPSTITQSNNDTSITLFINGQQLDTKERIILSITHYTGKAGIFSIAAKQAGASYIHATGTSIAIGGIVAITKFTDDSIIGYFNFDTGDGIVMTSGTFTVPIPFYVAHP